MNLFIAHLHPHFHHYIIIINIIIIIITILIFLVIYVNRVNKIVADAEQYLKQEEQYLGRLITDGER